MAKLIPLNEAAEMLGVSPEELAELRSDGEIHGYRDGTSWKFKQEEIERVAAERGIDGGEESDDDEEDDLLAGVKDEDDVSEDEESEDEVGSVLVSEEELGHSGETTSSTIIGKKDTPAESDLRLADESDLKRADESSSEVELTGGAESDLQLVEGGSSPKAAGEPGSDVELDDSAADSDLNLVAGGSDAPGASDTGKLSDAGGEESELGLSADESDVGLSADESDVGLATSSEIDLSGDEDEDELVIGGSGFGSDLALGGDSGINLSPTDSGLSLDEEPLDLGGSSVEQLELPEDDDMVSLEEDIGDPDAATQLKADDEFLLTPVEEAEDESSGSQVIALDEDSAVYDADAPMQQPLVAEDADMMGEGVEGAAGRQAVQGQQYAALPTEALPQAKYSVWNVLSLLVILLFLGVTGIFVTDLMRNVFGAETASGPSNALMDKIVNAVGLGR